MPISSRASDYLRRSLSAANAITPLSTPSPVTALPASISGTGVAYALVANTSSAHPITAQYHFFILYSPLERLGCVRLRAHLSRGHASSEVMRRLNGFK